MNDIPVRRRAVKNEQLTVENVENAWTNYEEQSAEDRLISFVEEQIDRMKAYGNLGNGMPGFYELNQALTNFNEMNCSLIALDVMAKEDYQKAKNAYDEFIAEKYMEARTVLNPTSLSATKWASTQEINYYVQTTWKDEYRKLRDELNACEKKTAFCRRLLDNMEDFRYNISRLSRNQEVEAGGFRDRNTGEAG